MLIQLTDADLAQMPSSLSSDLLQWFQSKQAKPIQQSSSPLNLETMPHQLGLDVSPIAANSGNSQQPTFKRRTQFAQIDQFQQDFSLDSREKSHVRISQLFDMGLISKKTQIRIRLTQDKAKQIGCNFVANIQISAKGTAIYENEEFDKPSPLATKANGRSVNGWEYIEIKRNGEWICLNELRKVWRNVS